MDFEDLRKYVMSLPELHGDSETALAILQDIERLKSRRTGNHQAPVNQPVRHRKRMFGLWEGTGRIKLSTFDYVITNYYAHRAHRNRKTILLR